MRYVFAAVLTLATLGAAPAAVADPNMTAPTEWADQGGTVWQCEAWDDTNGCNTGQEWFDSQGGVYTLWIAPDGHRHWHRSNGAQNPSPPAGPSGYTMMAECADGTTVYR